MMDDPTPNPSLSLEARPRLAAKARVQQDRVSGRPALLYPEGVLLLNPTGAAIVELCDGRRTVAEMAAVLAERYAAPADQLAADIIEYLHRLQEKRLLDVPTE